MGHNGPQAHSDDQSSGTSRFGCSDSLPHPAPGTRGDTDGMSPIDDRVIPASSLPSLKRIDPQLGIPFVVQAGSALFMLASESTVWTLAELRFDTESCTFVEASRVRYDWPREAFGSMLSRVALSGEIDHGLINRITVDFSTWLAQQFVGSLPE